MADPQSPQKSSTVARTFGVASTILKFPRLYLDWLAKWNPWAKGIGIVVGIGFAALTLLHVPVLSLAAGIYHLFVAPAAAGSFIGSALSYIATPIGWAASYLLATTALTAATGPKSVRNAIGGFAERHGGRFLAPARDLISHVFSHAPLPKPDTIVSAKLDAAIAVEERNSHIKAKTDKEIRQYIEEQIAEARKYAKNQYKEVEAAVVSERRGSLAWLKSLPGAFFFNSERKAAAQERDRRLKAIDERERKIDQEIKEVRLQTDDHGHLPAQTPMDNLEDRRAKLIVDFTRAEKELTRRRTPEGAKEYAAKLLKKIQEDLQGEIDVAKGDPQKKDTLENLKKQMKAVKAAKEKPDVYINDIMKKARLELAKRITDYDAALKEIESQIADAKRPGAGAPAPTAAANNS